MGTAAAEADVELDLDLGDLDITTDDTDFEVLAEELAR